MKIFLTALALFSLSSVAQAQSAPIRYIDVVNENVVVEKDVAFSTNIPTVRVLEVAGNKLAIENTFGQRIVNLKMDIYRPAGDGFNNKPVIIFAFGGAFINGDKSNDGMVQLCREFAKRGYVAASMNYRLGMNVTDQELSKRAVYRALQDGHSAVRFFRKNANFYGIDRHKIFLAGQSSGALLALHTAFLDKDSERPASTRSYKDRQDLLGIEDIGDNKTYPDGSLVSGMPNAVVSFAGSLGETTYIEGPKDVPAIYFHSADDNIMPIDSGEPFTDFNSIPGFNLPVVFGSNRLSNRSVNVGAPHAIYLYSDRGHSVHFDTAKKGLYPDIVPRVAKFLYESNINPLPAQGNSMHFGWFSRSMKTLFQQPLTADASHFGQSKSIKVLLAGGYRGRIQIILYDNSGRILFAKNGQKRIAAQAESIDTTLLANGVYFLVVMGDDNLQIIKEIVIK